MSYINEGLQEKEEQINNKMNLFSILLHHHPS